MVAHNFKIPPKAPNRKLCGKCEGCKCESAKQSAPNHWPEPSMPIPPEARLIGHESSGFFGAALLSLAGIALFLLGFIAAMELVK